MLKSESSNSHGSPGVRPTRSSTSRSKESSIDEQALSLRETNMSYAAIARKLKLTRAVDAHKAFIRAILSRQGDEQPGLVANERARLDKLEVPYSRTRRRRSRSVAAKAAGGRETPRRVTVIHLR